MFTRVNNSELTKKNFLPWNYLEWILQVCTKMGKGQRNCINCFLNSWKLMHYETSWEWEKKSLHTLFCTSHNVFLSLCEIAFNLFLEIYFSTLAFLNEVCITIRINLRKYTCLKQVKMHLHKKLEASYCEPPALLCNKRNFNVNDLNWSRCRYGKLIQRSETGSREQNCNWQQ